MKKRKRKGIKRYRNRNFHHLFPRERGGDDSKENLLLLKIERHECWHKLFQNRTLNEVIHLLHRIQRMRSDYEFQRREMNNDFQGYYGLHSER
jgi:hypothetical protein